MYPGLDASNVAKVARDIVDFLVVWTSLEVSIRFFVEVKISLYGQVFECAQTGVGGHVACGECASGGV